MSEFIRLGIGTRVRCLWTRDRTFRFHERWGVSWPCQWLL